MLDTCHKEVPPLDLLSCPVFKRKWHQTLRARGVYERFQDANFQAIQKRGVPGEIKKQYGRVVNYVQQLDQRLKAGDGLILKGPVGTMKTTLAVAVLQEALARGYTVRKILMQSLLDDIFTLKAQGSREWLQYEQDLRNVSLLVVDELGKHKSEGWVMNKFEAIVSERHERRRSTIFVTNLTTDEIRGMYSEGVIDRFNHVSDVITFTGQSQRVKGD